MDKAPVTWLASSSVDVPVEIPAITGASLVLMTARLKVMVSVALAASVTVMLILAVVPTSLLVGVPDNTPLEASNEAQLGLLVMLKVVVSIKFASVTVGVKV